MELATKLLLSWTIAWSCAMFVFSTSEIAAMECNEPIITQCQCGDSQLYQDVYVLSCQVNSTENSSHCEPCPGSCEAFKQCKTCSKDGCLTCPYAKIGHFCENSEKNNTTEASADKMEVQNKKISEESSIYPLKSTNNTRIKSLPPIVEETKNWKLKSNLKKYPAPEKTSTTTSNEDVAPSSDGTRKMNNGDEFVSNVKRETNHSLSNEKFTSIQKAKKKSTILHDSVKVERKEELFPITTKQENETYISNDKFIDDKDSIMYRSDLLNSSTSGPIRDLEEKRSQNSSKSSEKGDFRFNFGSKENLPHKHLKSEKHEAINDVPLVKENQWKFRLANPEIYTNSPIQKHEPEPNLTPVSSNQGKFMIVNEDVYTNSPKDKPESESNKMEDTFNQRNLSFESPEVYTSSAVEKHETKLTATDDLSSEQKNAGNTGQLLEKDIHFKGTPSSNIPFSYRKSSLDISKSENKSASTLNEGGNLKPNKMRYLSAFVFGKREPEKDNFSEITIEERSDSAEKNFESPEIINPLKIFVKVIVNDTIGNISSDCDECTNSSRELLEKYKMKNSSETNLGMLSPLSEIDSKEYEIVSPLEINIFKMTFVGDPGDTPLNNQNFKTNESAIIENGEKTNTSQMAQNETSELHGNSTKESEAKIPLNNNMFRATLSTNNTTSNKLKKQNTTTESDEGNRGISTKEKTANYKRNATYKPDDKVEYDIDILHKMIMQSQDKFRELEDDQSYSSEAFLNSNIPDNHILMPLYFPKIYNAESYQRSSLDNGQLHKLCDLYPNYGPCFRVRMLEPRRPYIGSQSQIDPKLHQFKTLTNERYYLPQMSYYFSKSNMIDENGQDSLVLGLVKQFLKLMNSQIPQSYLMRKSPPLNGDLVSGQPSLVQESNENVQPEEVINLNFFVPKYGGKKIAAHLHQQELKKDRPGKLGAGSHIALKADQPFQSKSFPEIYGQLYNRQFNQLDSLEGGSDYSKENLVDSVQKYNATSKTIPDAADTIQILFIHPMTSQFLSENKTNKTGKMNFLESPDNTFLENCVQCVYSESIYETIDGNGKSEKALPTIYRTLIVEEVFENDTDSKTQNASRSKRSSHIYGTHEWCPIQRKMLNGDLDCTIWSYQKVCSIQCHPGYAGTNQHFSCSRKTNSWNPNIGGCKPTKQYNSFGYRQGNTFSNESFSGENENVGNYADKSSSLFDNMDTENQEDSHDFQEKNDYQEMKDNSEYNGYSTNGTNKSHNRKLALDRKGNTLDNNKNYDMLGEQDTIRDVSDEVTIIKRKGNSKSGKNLEFPEIMDMDDKGNDHELAFDEESSDGERTFDLYEKQGNTSYRKGRKDSVDKSSEKKHPGKQMNQDSDTVYSLFERANPETFNDDA